MLFKGELTHVNEAEKSSYKSNTLMHAIHHTIIVVVKITLYIIIHLLFI